MCYKNMINSMFPYFLAIYLICDDIKAFGGTIDYFFNIKAFTCPAKNILIPTSYTKISLFLYSSRTFTPVVRLMGPSPNKRGIMLQLHCLLSLTLV